MAKLKLEYLKCPIHAAVLNGQLKSVMQIFSLTSIHVLQKPNGYGVSPWQMAVRKVHYDDYLKNKMQKGLWFAYLKLIILNLISNFNI
jgi:hypothetical protein